MFSVITFVLVTSIHWKTAGCPSGTEARKLGDFGEVA